jgi:hypothetical protein
MVRAINDVTNKPEVATTVTSQGTAVKTVAIVVSGVPNIMLQQNNIESIIGNDLRLTYSEGLDWIVKQGLATAGTQTLSTDPLLSVVRRSVSVLWAAGYNPDTLIVTPAALGSARHIDVGRHGRVAGAVCVRRPGRFGRRRCSA